MFLILHTIKGMFPLNLSAGLLFGRSHLFLPTIRFGELARIVLWVLGFPCLMAYMMNLACDKIMTRLSWTS